MKRRVKSSNRYRKKHHFGKLRKYHNFENLLFTPKQATFIVHNLGAPKHFPHVYQFQGGSVKRKKRKAGGIVISGLA